MPLPKLSPPELRDANNSAATDVSLLEAEIRSSFMQMVVNTLGGERTSSFSEDDQELGFAFGEKAPAEESALPKGSVIGGRFTVQKPLGRGGFGTVYLAHDESLDRDVAIKVPHEKLRSDPQLSSQCLKEARLAAKLRHPSIVTIYDISEDEGRISHIVQEYVRGATLYELIAKQRFSIKQTIVIVMKVAEAIAFAHARGVYHRDLKPANLILDDTGGIRVLDFGLAVDEEMQRGARGQVAGTLAYMSPEQIEGRTHHLDGRTDIWSLGVIFYELLTGRRPFRGTTLEITDQVTHREAAPPRQFMPSIPKKVEACCLKCLAKSVSARYGTAVDLLEDLKEIIDTEPLPEDLPSGPLPTIAPHDTRKLGKDTTKGLPTRRAAKHWIMWGTASAFILAFVLFFGYLGMQLFTNDTTKDPGDEMKGPKSIQDGKVVNEVSIIEKELTAVISPPRSHIGRGPGLLSIHTEHEFCAIFDSVSLKTDFEISLLVQETPWRDSFAILIGVRESTTSPNMLLGKMIEVSQSHKKPSEWFLTCSHVQIDKNDTGSIPLKTCVSEKMLIVEPEGTIEFSLTVKNNKIDRVKIGQSVHRKIGAFKPSEVTLAEENSRRHQYLFHDLSGKLGLYLSSSNLAVTSAIVGPPR